MGIKEKQKIMELTSTLSRKGLQLSMEEMIEVLSCFVIGGLQTDGAHHKQWYLERVGIGLGVDLKKVDYEKGIAP